MLLLASLSNFPFSTLILIAELECELELELELESAGAAWISGSVVTILYRYQQRTGNVDCTQPLRQPLHFLGFRSGF